MSNDIKLRLLVEAVNRTGRQLQSTTNDLNKISMAAVKVGNKTNQAGIVGAKGVKKIGAGAKKAKVDLNKLDKVMGELKGAGLSLIAMGTALSAAVFFPIKSAANFQKTMSGVRAVTDLTEKQFKALSEEAKRLGASTRYTATEAAQGLKFLGLAGLSATEALAALEPTLNLASAGELEVAEAADIATNAMSAMNLQVSDLDHVMDALAFTAANSNTNVRQMADALKYVAPLAAAAGIDIDTLSALIGRLGSNGIQASQAGTSLRGMIIALSAPTIKASKALKSLNVTVTKNKDGSLDLVSTLRDLFNAQMGVNEATAIFRRVAAPAAIALAKETAEVEKLRDGVTDADGASKKMASTLLGNLIGATIKLKSAIEGLSISVGEPLLKPLTKLIDFFTEIVRIFKVAADEYKTLSTILASSIGTVGLVAFSFGGFLTTVGLLGNGLIKLTAAYKALKATRLGEWIFSMVLGMKSYIAQTKIASFVTWGLNTAITAFKITLGPVAVAITLITTAVVALISVAPSLYGMLSAFKENRDAAKRFREEMERLAGAKDNEIKAITEIKNLTQEEARTYRKSLVEKLKYWTAAQNEQFSRRKDAKAEAEEIKKILKAINDVGRYGVKAFKDVNTTVKYGSEIFKEYEKTITEGYKEATKEADKYYKIVLDFEEKIKYEKLSIEDKIRALRRKGMDEEQAWYDRKKQAEEKISSAKEALANKDFKLAESLAKESQSLYLGLAESIKTTTAMGDEVIKKRLVDTINIAESGGRRASDALTKIWEVQAKEAKIAGDAQMLVADELGRKLDDIAKDREAGIKPVLVGMRYFQEDINRKLAALDLKARIRLEADDIETRSRGGAVKMAFGGKLPGESKKDSIPVMARPGEWFIRNESAQSWDKTFGSGFMSGINNPMSDFGKRIKSALLGSVPRFNFGGMVQTRFQPVIPRYADGGKVGGIKNLGSVNINAGGNSYPVFGETDVLSKLKDAIEKENLTRANN